MLTYQICPHISHDIIIDIPQGESLYVLLMSLGMVRLSNHRYIMYGPQDP